MRLLSLTLNNFQGVKEFTIDPAGNDLAIYGDNGTGKTTLANAFHWLLFGKDSLGQAQFEIKPLLPDGSTQHGLTTEVVAVLLNGTDRQTTLKKTYAEKYTKKRGSAQAELTGHEINHFVDGVPVKAGEFSSAVSRLCDENLFKLLTNPRYFNEQLHWQKRREMLLSICGDVAEQDVIASDARLDDLPKILNGRKLDDHKKVLAASRTEINKQLQEIPARIDEATRSKVDTGALSPNEIGAKIAALTDEIKAKRTELSRLQNGGELAEKRKALAEIKAALLEIDNHEATLIQQAEANKRDKLFHLLTTVNNLKIEIDSASRMNAVDERMVSDIDKELSCLRAEFDAENSRSFDYVPEDVCPTCNRPLPTERVEDARNKALKEFNFCKAEKLRGMNARGKEITAMKRDLTLQIAIRRDGSAKQQVELESAEKRMAEVSEQTLAIDPNPQKDKLLAGKQILDDAISQIESTPDAVSTNLEAIIVGLELNKQVLHEHIAAFESNKKTDTRIESLKKQERDLARKCEEIEKQLHLGDCFTRRKVSMLTDKINGEFRLAKWMLFDEQLNGGITECCECTVNGVPYNSLNNAAKTQVGLDIANTLSRYHGVGIPCWVDNRESIVRLPQVDFQIISLVVSEHDKQLRIVKEGDKSNGR